MEAHVLIIPGEEAAADPVAEDNENVPEIPYMPISAADANKRITKMTESIHRRRRRETAKSRRPTTRSSGISVSEDASHQGDDVSSMAGSSVGNQEDQPAIRFVRRPPPSTPEELQQRLFAQNDERSVGSVRRRMNRSVGSGSVASDQADIQLNIENDCAPCLLGNDRHDIEMMPAFQVIRDFHRNQILEMDPDKLYQHIQEYYKNKMIDPALKKHGRRLPPMSPEKWRVHFSRHCCDPYVKAIERIRYIDDVMLVIQNRVILARNDREMAIDEDSAKIFSMMNGQFMALCRFAQIDPASAKNRRK